MEALIPLYRLPPAILDEDGEVCVIETELEVLYAELQEELDAEYEAYLNSPEYEEYCREASEDEERTRRASYYW